MDEYQNDTERELTASLRQMAAADAVSKGASPAVRARLLQEVRAVARAERRSVMKLYALAAVLVIATAIPVWQLSTRTATDTSLRPSAASLEVATDFYPLTYSAIPVNQGRLLRLEMPAASLAALGVDPAAVAGPQQGSVVADVLVGEDGLARAVRFVRGAGAK
jgi:uncharacterized protein YcaQ